MTKRMKTMINFKTFENWETINHERDELKFLIANTLNLLNDEVLVDWNKLGLPEFENEVPLDIETFVLNLEDPRLKEIESRLKNNGFLR